MSKRHAIRALIPLTATALLATGLGLRAVRSEADDKPGPAPSADELAIRRLDEEFVRDYDKGDSKALAALFAEDAEVIEADGGRFRGRGPVEEAFAAVFADSPGSKLTIEIDSIQFFGADVAKEEGRSTVTPPKGAPISRAYNLLFVKRDGRWLISSDREDPDQLTRPHDRLKDLEWMVGDWVDEGSESEVRVHCAWSEDENFLIRKFTVKRQGTAVMTVTQRIGWDPLSRQVRSWEFDSEGGFGEGKWSRDGGRWVIKHTAVRPEGTAVSATNIVSPERPDLVRWVSIDRVIGDRSIPDDEAYTLVRVPPPPGRGPNAPETATPTTNPSRSPR